MPGWLGSLCPVRGGKLIRPEDDFPDTCAVPIRLPKVATVLRHIAFDVDELTRARRVDDLQAVEVADDPRAERRRRPAEPDLEYAEFCDRTGTPWRSTVQGELAWTAYRAERRRRGETDEEPFEVDNPFRQGS
ncbi:hypothetical protein GCM10027073_64310 [Streptomyces chlorus]|uniref:Uncharacterized protein n=1 Tax=Streptomyces chlorus TaxID=887452 RepID=A0ABW1DZX6_9ACTN